MKKIVLLFTFLAGPISLCAILDEPQPPQIFSDKVSAIDYEISNLQRQKQQLQLEIKAEYHKEMNQEMQSQKDFIEYDWPGVSGSLKQAEAAEHNARRGELDIKSLDLEIQKLTRERELLKHESPRR